MGSGNPEEGELRPQLLDRFGMHAFIRTVKEPAMRVKIVVDRQMFDDNPESFRDMQTEEQEGLALRIIEARGRLMGVRFPHELKILISKVCSGLNVDGIRGDIVACRASRALAAFEGKEEVGVKEVSQVIVLALRHRLRKDPLSMIDDGDRVLDEFNKVFGEPQTADGGQELQDANQDRRGESQGWTKLESESESDQEKASWAGEESYTARRLE